VAKAARQQEDRLLRDIAAVALATVGALVLASLVYGREGHGYLPHVLNNALFLAVGLGAYAVPLAAWLLAGIYGLDRRPLAAPRVVAGLGLLFLVLVILCHLGTPQDELFFDPVSLRGGGGYVGAAFAWLLLKALGVGGALIIVVGLTGAAILLISQATARQLVRGSVGLVAKGATGARRYARVYLPARPKRKRQAPSTRSKSKSRRVRPSGRKRVDLEDDDEARLIEVPPDDSTESAKRRRTTGSSRSKSRARTELDSESQLPLIKRQESFVLPSLDLLTAIPEEKETSEMRKQDNQRIVKLEDTLASFGIQARVVHYERGPVLTRYEVAPERGIKVSQVVRLADDLAMSLAAIDVRVEAPIPGKSAIGIEVPNERRGMVSLRGLLETDEFQNCAYELPIALGRDISGKPIVVDLVTMPHMLVGGATGSGKSVCLHSAVISLLICRTPDQVRFMIIDPKRVEMAVYDGMPHLMAPVVHSVKQAADALRKVIREMEKRYTQFALKGVVNVSEYNDLARMPKQSVLDEFEPLPRFVIIIDELADLMMQARAEFEFSICRIAQLARATGIHLLLATQRPSVKVITGNIKANIPSRVALAVASQHDSRTILDGQGAERLIGQGDMLYAPLEAPKPIRMQGSFVSREEIEKVVAFLRKQGEPEFQIIPEVPEDDRDAGGDLDVDDELYAAAVQYIVEQGEASVSMVQRRFKVGYARAGRLIDMMEQRGVVGPHEGSKPRQVLVGRGMLDAVLQGRQEAEDYGDEVATAERLPRQPAALAGERLEDEPADAASEQAERWAEEDEYPFYEELEDDQ